MIKHNDQKHNDQGMFTTGLHPTRKIYKYKYIRLDKIIGET